MSAEFRLSDEQPAAAEVCDHYWAWVSPAGARGAARLCMTCHQPDPAWLNEIDDRAEAAERALVARVEQALAPFIGADFGFDAKVVKAVRAALPAPSDIAAKIEASSLGTPEAKALRATVSDEHAARIVARAAEMDAALAGSKDGERPGVEACARCGTTRRLHADPAYHHAFVCPAEPATGGERP